MHEKQDKECPCDDCNKQVVGLDINNEEVFEIYNKCGMARDGMSGCLDFGVLLKIMELEGIDNEEQLIIFEKVSYLENHIQSQKQNENNFSQNSHQNIKQRHEQNKSNMKL